MVGSNRRKNSVASVEDGGGKREVEQDIGGLIGRLRNTIVSDAEKREPSKIPLSKGDEFKTEGVKVMDAKQLATTTGEKVKKNMGRAVPQDAVRARIPLCGIALCGPTIGRCLRALNAWVCLPMVTICCAGC